MPDEDKPITDLEKDPDVLAAKKRLRLTELSLQRYKAIAEATQLYMQTFKAEAVSLISGVTTIVLGYRTLRKRSGGREVKQESSWTKKPQVLLKSVDGGTVQEDKSGSLATIPEAPTGSAMTLSVSSEVPQTVMKDPESYALVVSVAILVWGIIYIKIKKRRKDNVAIQQQAKTTES